MHIQEFNKIDSDQISVKVENVSKKFCRSLKRSLVYGVQDIGREVIGLQKKEGLRKNEFWAINDVSFEVRRGEAVGLIGPNGAGKSTLLKMLNGLIKPDKGNITMRGRVGALIELGTGFNPILTGRENVYINGAVLGLTKKEIHEKFDEIVAFSEIEEFIDTPVQNYSSGMRVRLGFAVAANLEPDILLIDEVLAVGDIRFRLKCYDHLNKLKQQGVSMIIVSHSLNQLSRVCARTIVFNKGRMDFDGGVSEGILSYDKLMLLNNLKRNNLTTVEDYGISLTTELKNANGDITTKFRTGEDLIIEFSIFSKINLENVRVVFWIDSANFGVIGGFSSSFSRYALNIKKGASKFSLTLPLLPLTTGSYSLNLELYGRSNKDLFYSRNGFASLEIKGPNTYLGFGTGSGVFLFEHEWKGVNR